MKLSSYPSVRTLFWVWLVLIALSAGTLFTGRVTTDETLGIWGAAALFAITFFKTKLILNYYLDLKAATGNWNTLFSSLIFLILLILFGLYGLSIFL
ncbi:MAG: cytochrome C oxidase subunit IV family protein [Sneathiella sp.]